MRRLTYGNEQHSVQSRARSDAQPENRARQADLLHLPKDVDTEAGDDDGGYADPACACLHGLEDEHAHDGDEGSEPGVQFVDATSDEGRGAYAENTNETKETDDEAGEGRGQDEG